MSPENNMKISHLISKLLLMPYYVNMSLIFVAAVPLYMPWLQDSFSKIQLWSLF